MNAHADGSRLVDEAGDVLAQAMYHRDKSQWRVHAVFDVANESGAESLLARLADAVNGGSIA
ncbi:hypothetical protein [Mycobacteroides abscessus]|uniref:hypothetical protein n=1 Tax=Mycobacteroides abscessus TaxID=36809 RepID=UPI0005E2EBE8|nr:hypothetical protein [Mycobacteroides abscessus]CPS10196.1 Uncharacterised protein [Mycobacteroides abscessus]CPS26372.1 Uncharacterised protein [Mycobacteroides abscessus]CPS28893.1 Uncharacterised protein [Mycobacteroides abscessus]CPT09714.1 Uncharacterised protein [Mycobacteroides abscessus]CPT29328.1 Uncharacterised protein [Mycobacteroides abscessus]